MTVQIKTMTVPTVREITESVTCDLCKQVFTTAQPSGHVVEWSSGYGTREETGVVFAEGDAWPGDIDITYKYWHICPPCFREKLIPWLQSFGAQPSIVEY
jgi:hypothetical protein